MLLNVLKVNYFLFVTILFLKLLISNGLIAQENCKPDLIPFRGGESLSYKIQYHWGFIWMTAGEVTFTVEDTVWKNSDCYHFKGVGRTYDNYDWFFKVRDTYESWSHKDKLLPYEYRRDVSEGGRDSKNHYMFNYEKDLIYAEGLKNNKDFVLDTLGLNNCLFDVMSLVYYARCIDFKQYQKEELIPLSIVLDNKLHNIHIKCLGKDTLNVNDNYISVLKFSSELIEGSIFNKGDEMFIWVSDDEKRIPLKVKAEIIVGSIEASLID